VGPTLKELFIQKHRIEDEKIDVIYNGFDEEDFSGIVPTDTDLFTITYVGTLSESYPIDTFLDALQDLLTNHPEIRIRFVGSVSYQQQQMLARIPDRNVELIPQVEHHQAITYMVQSDMLLLVIPRHSSGKGIVTGKVFEYLASGTPILGIGPPDGDSAHIIRETKRGTVHDYEDKFGLLNTLAAQLGDRIKSGDSHPDLSDLPYSRKALTSQLAGIMNRLQHRTLSVF
jgi:glycosyltransferase involved in cell wall biosynthesis